MEAMYRVEVTPCCTNSLSVPPELAGQTGLVSEITLEFGCRQIAVRLDGSVPAGEPLIRLSTDLIEELHVATDCRYRVRADQRRIRIGPVVGIVAARDSEQMTPERLGTLTDHLLFYEQLGGLFIAFARDAMDPEGATVTGFRYCGEGRWEPGQFAMPQAIFKRFGVALGERIGPLKALGVQVFNERIFDKWEAAEWLSADPDLRAYLPETVDVKGPGTILEMLERHACVFVKPITGAQGKRILRVRRGESGFTLDVVGEGEILCADEAELAAALEPRLPQVGIAQQGLTLATAGGRLIDFRIMLLKDGSGAWSIPGIVSRCGASGNFVSNMAAGGFPIRVERSLSLLFGKGSALTFRRKQELIRLGLAVGDALDRTGLLLGDIGLDVAYDVDDHLWIIEVNNRYPDHCIAWESGQWSMFYRARSLPMAYASFLAGFGSQEGDLA